MEHGACIELVRMHTEHVHMNGGFVHVRILCTCMKHVRMRGDIVGSSRVCLQGAVLREIGMHAER